MEKPLFEKYADLIRKRAHEYSEKTGVDYKELESQGFLIYCECLQKFDISKSSFCTYLYIQLNRLGDYAKTYIRQQGVLIQDYYCNSNLDYSINKKNNYEQMIVARQISPTVFNLLNEAKQILSDNAYNLMEWIVSRVWERKNKRKPTIQMAMRYFNLSKQAVEKMWEECGNFWNRKGFALYA